MKGAALSGKAAEASTVASGASEARSEAPDRRARGLSSAAAVHQHQPLEPHHGQSTQQQQTHQR